MKHNTPDAMASNRTRASLGEQWMPVPTRLVDALVEAPSVRRRMWAVAYLLLWLLTFRRKSKGAPATLGELEAWSATNSRQRTVKARKDAVSAVEQWTDRGLAVDKKWTGGAEVQAPKPKPIGQAVDKKRTAHTGANLQTTELQNYKNNNKGLLETAEKKPDDTTSDVWKQVNALRRTAGKRVWGLNDSRRTALKARIKEHSAEEVVSVFRWFINSPDAEWNRDNWKTPADTLLRPKNFLGYLERSQSPESTTAPAKSPQNVLMTPEAIWQAMMSVMSRVGGRRLPVPADAPELDAETFQRALAVLGGPARWTALCSTRTNDLQFRVRPAFVRSFRKEVA